MTWHTWVERQDGRRIHFGWNYSSERAFNTAFLAVAGLLHMKEDGTVEVHHPDGTVAKRMVFGSRKMHEPEIRAEFEKLPEAIQRMKKQMAFRRMVRSFGFAQHEVTL